MAAEIRLLQRIVRISVSLTDNKRNLKYTCTESSRVKCMVMNTIMAT